ncbi:Alpha/Beta hydrolase protein [Panaeolus papilionaceus]|nr:Alpha/Beta hydrolase protein [Panaeolus papilionaceus]
MEFADPTTTSSPTDPVSHLPTAFDSSTCLRRGLCPVTSLRPQGPEALESHSLYFEQHGPKFGADTEGPKYKVVFIMGLNSSSFSWGGQVRWFGNGGEGVRMRAGEVIFDEEEEEEDSSFSPAHSDDAGEQGTTQTRREGKGQFSCLVFDNRGVGNSGYPRGPYSTSGMAEDVICLLDYIGWTGERELNVVGISLGGMIAQELAYRIPNRISSLLLAVTTPGGMPWNNLPPWTGVSSLARLLVTPEPEKKIPIVMNMIFSNKWLGEKARGVVYPGEDKSKSGDEGKTNYDVQAAAFLRRVSITLPQRLLGHISQMCAGLTHHTPTHRLRHIARSIPKIIILTGDQDNLVRPSGSFKLKEGMDTALAPAERTGLNVKGGRVELLQWEETGHGIHAQRETWFNRLVERCAVEGRMRVEGGFK